MSPMLMILLGALGLFGLRKSKTLTLGQRLIWLILMLTIMAVEAWLDKGVRLYLFVFAIALVINLPAEWYYRRFIKRLAAMPPEEQHPIIERNPSFFEDLDREMNK